MQGYHERGVIKWVYPIKTEQFHGVHQNTGDAPATHKPRIISICEAGCLRNPTPMMRSLRVPGELLVFRPHWNAEGAGFRWQPWMVAIVSTVAQMPSPARSKSRDWWNGSGEGSTCCQANDSSSSPQDPHGDRGEPTLESSPLPST